VGSWLKERDFATQEQAQHQVVRTLHVVRILFISLIAIFSFCYFVKLFSSQPVSFAFFPSDSPPHPPGEGARVKEQLHGSLLPTEAKPQ